MSTLKIRAVMRGCREKRRGRLRARRGPTAAPGEWSLVGIAFLAIWLGGRAAAAASRCTGSDPWVLVQLRAEGWSGAQRQGVLQDLEHTLAEQGIAVCLADLHPTGPPLATVAIHLGVDDRAAVDIQISDEVTHKRVRRDVDLAPIPSDGRELAIAIEADELLRASWAEVALDTARARDARPRQEVVSSVAEVLVPSRSDHVRALGARAAGETYAGGTSLLGGDAFGRLRLSNRLSLEVAGTVRASPAATTVHGRVRAVAAGASLDLMFRLAGKRSASVDAGAGFSGSWLEYRAEPVAGTEASPYANLLLVGRAGIVGHLALGRTLAVSAGVSAGAALRGVQVTDTGQTVTGATGFELGATLGLEAL